ncbi:MAG: hypothetical protein K2L02_04775 [Clostridia bacterium]|nr:hypothetical protein [Clostridia bacterium]
MTILTPVTLWKDFDDTLPLEEETLSETECGNMVVRDVFFSGRKTEKGRVKIYAQYVFPKDEEEFPVVMILFDAGSKPDMRFVRRFVARGYGVLCVDYCGDNGSTKYTYYPQDVDYANYVRAGRAMRYAEPTAKETSWYEWAGVARYAVRYLTGKPEVKSVGAIGLRTGGEILFKIAPYANLSCMISVCAAGWLAYQDIERFGDGKQSVFNEERHRFIAGIDSQSYAPYVKCPLLLISAVSDKKYNYDRVYDTFQQINPEVEKALLYSSHGNGLVGRRSLADIDLFLDKFMKERSVYLSAPTQFSVDEDENENLIVTIKNDPDGEVVDCGYFYTEKAARFRTRDWTRVICDTGDIGKDGVVKIPLSVYEGSEKILIYTFVRYSNGFSATSKIQEFEVKKQYRNSCMLSRVIYDAQHDKLNGFARFVGSRPIAGCFAAGEVSEQLEGVGYGGIKGICADAVISYRVGEPRYEAPANCSISFDLWSEEDVPVQVTFYKDEDEQTGYSATVKLEGGGKWKNFILDPEDFKSETGNSLENFRDTVSIVFHLDNRAVINNVLWL